MINSNNVKSIIEDFLTIPTKNVEELRKKMQEILR